MTQSTLVRSGNRTLSEQRPVKITPGYVPDAEGSALIETGNTVVMCAATVETRVPPWMRGKGTGWVTAEYSMLPRSTRERVRRERSKVGGRTQEIQRLIGRALRSVTDLSALGEISILLDCDVLRADGGTREQAGQIATRALGMLGQGLGDVRRAVEHGAAFPLDQGQGLAGLEMMLQDHGPAMAQHGE